MKKEKKKLRRVKRWPYGVKLNRKSYGNIAKSSMSKVGALVSN